MHCFPYPGHVSLLAHLWASDPSASVAGRLVKWAIRPCTVRVAPTRLAVLSRSPATAGAGLALPSAQSPEGRHRRLAAARARAYVQRRPPPSEHRGWGKERDDLKGTVARLSHQDSGEELGNFLGRRRAWAHSQSPLALFGERAVRYRLGPSEDRPKFASRIGLSGLPGHYLSRAL